MSILPSSPAHNGSTDFVAGSEHMAGERQSDAVGEAGVGMAPSRQPRPRTRVSFFMPSFSGGGTEHNVLTLCRHFAERGHEVDLVLIRAEGPLRALLSEKVRLVDLRAPVRALAIPRLAAYLRRERPDVLVAAMTLSNCISTVAHWLARSETRLVLSERSTFSHEIEDRWFRFWLPQAVRWLYPRADRVIAVSKGVAEDLAKATGLPRDRIGVTYNPVITADLETRAAEPAHHPWFADATLPVVLGAGRLSRQKDFALLLRAFAEVRKTRPCRLVILGDGEERAALETLARELGVGGDVAFPGFALNPYPYLARAGVFVLSSRWEGLPTVLIEAMALGVPVVSTDCASGPREILDGSPERLVAVGDREGLARAIAAALDDARPVAYGLEMYEAERAVDVYEAEILGAG